MFLHRRPRLSLSIFLLSALAALAFVASVDFDLALWLLPLAAGVVAGMALSYLLAYPLRLTDAESVRAARLLPAWVVYVAVMSGISMASILTDAYDSFDEGGTFLGAFFKGSDSFALFFWERFVNLSRRTPEEGGGRLMLLVIGFGVSGVVVSTLAAVGLLFYVFTGLSE